MTQVLEEHTTHGYLSRQQRQGGSSPSWLARLRQGALARFEEVGFPSPKSEMWRWTNFAPITRTRFEPADPHHLDEAAALVNQHTYKNIGAIEIVLVNGQFAPQLSSLGKAIRGVTVVNLAQAVASHGDLLDRHLGKIASIQRNPFVALNTGMIADGAVIHLASNVKLDQPISVLIVSTGGEKPVVAHPRVLIVAEDNVQATLIETYVGQREGQAVYFNNSVTEIFAGENCHLDHCRMQHESLSAYHVSTTQATLGTASTLVSHACNMGGKIVRNDVNFVMNGERAYAVMNGLVLVSGDQHCDNHTLLHHEKPNCPSHELYKHVLDGKATCVFKGQIFVQKDAQKTDSKQTNKSLLLSDDAYMNAQPALEIYADDVKCTHGSTTGPIDEDMVFYLRTRGVGLDAARHLLTYAFAADITRRIKVEPFRTRIEDFMAAQHGLPQDLKITDVTTHDKAAL